MINRDSRQDGPDAWWPDSPTGRILFTILLSLAFAASFGVGIARRSGPGMAVIDGTVNAVIWYFLVCAIRYVFVVRRARKSDRTSTEPR